MSTEQKDTDELKLVSAAYRELDAVHAPTHLNQAILKLASDETKHHRNAVFGFGTWTKPLAWTAVVALSLAVVLELAEVETPATPDLQPREIATAIPAEQPTPVQSFGKGRPAVQTDARDQAERMATPMSKKAAVAGCDAATRVSRDDWMACIQALRDEGAMALADLEYEALLLEFPPAD